MALVMNTFLFSCDKGSVAEDESLYETFATEGEDGEIDEDPDV